VSIELARPPASGVGKADARPPIIARVRAALDSRQFLFSPGFFILTRATAPHAISEAVNAADQDSPNKTHSHRSTLAQKVVSNQRDWTFDWTSQMVSALSASTVFLDSR
jgi:hypothetical protein